MVNESPVHRVQAFKWTAGRPSLVNPYSLTWTMLLRSEQKRSQLG